MPSPTISHMILTVALLVLFLVIAQSIQGLIVEYRGTLAREYAVELVDRASSQLTTAILLLQSIGSDNATIALEVLRRTNVDAEFYNIVLIPVDGGVKVKAVHVRTGGVVEGSPVVGCELPNATLVSIISRDFLEPMGINVIDDGREIYTGVNGTVVIWAVRLSGTVYVGLGWSEQ